MIELWVVMCYEEMGWQQLEYLGDGVGALNDLDVPNDHSHLLYVAPN